MEQQSFDLGDRREIAVYAPTGRDVVLGGGMEGAERTSRETFTWQGSPINSDRRINPGKPVADARASDIVLNDGLARGALSSHMDGTVGAQFRLNSKIVWQAIPGGTRAWALEAQEIIEQRFRLTAESNACYLDAAGMNTFTGLVRLAVCGFVVTGEVLATGEWLTASNRPCKTAVLMVSPDRLMNPDWSDDAKFMRRGVEVDFRGKPVAYHIRSQHPNAFYAEDNFDSRRILATKPWGRKQVIHIIEQLFPDQHRGVADMVSVLKRMKMTKHYQEVTLQNAVLNATYAAAIESEMPTAEIVAAMGGGATGFEQAIGSFLDGLQRYLAGSENINLDGVMVPHLYPGTKLNMKTAGTPGGVGTGFEDSLLRHTAAGLGLNYEEFARDYRKLSYASAKLSDAKTVRFMSSRKKMVADRFADELYSLWLEEEIAQGNIPLPPGQDRECFYAPLAKEAFCNATWIGSGRGQIDELKETQAAMLRVKAGFSTREKEIARLGDDYREIFAQLEFEDELIERHSLIFDTAPQRTGAPSPLHGNPGAANDEADDAERDDDGSGDDDDDEA
jgi:lambda family phage portal protein